MDKQAKIRKVMREFKNGTLKSSDGKKVTSRKQAIAIAMSEAEDYAEKADLISAIHIGSVREAEEILKAAGTEGDLFEKAHKVGDIHPNGKWVWTEYKPGKFDWRTIKNAPKTEEPKKEAPKKNAPKKNAPKLTPVQKQVMKRFENGEKLVQLETNRMSGDVFFWCSFDKESGLWYAKEKALYPQLRRLFWNHVITDEHFIKPEQLDKEYNCDELHRSGAIGF